MQLVEQGRLILSDPVARYLPAFAQVQVAHMDNGQMQLRAPRAAITVYDLLRHTAGMTYEFLGQSPVQKMYDAAGLRTTTRDYSNAQFAELLASMPLMCAARSGFGPNFGQLVTRSGTRTFGHGGYRFLCAP